MTSASRPEAQKSLKNIGKKAAITVVAKAELPPSYKIHAFATGESLGHLNCLLFRGLITKHIDNNQCWYEQS